MYTKLIERASNEVRGTPANKSHIMYIDGLSGGEGLTIVTLIQNVSDFDTM